MDPQIAVYVFSAVGLVAAVAIGVWQHLRQRKRAAEPAPEEPKPDVAPTVYRSSRTPDGACHFCALPAERPPSRMQPSIWDGWRVRLGMAPRYTIAVEAGAEATLCRGHGRLWDALLQAKTTSCVRARQEQAHIAAAADIAAYESEQIISDMHSRLTDKQREALATREKSAEEPKA